MKLLVFASGTAVSGGSGFENLVVASRSGKLSAGIVGVVSNHAHGGVFERAHRLGVEFRHFAGPYDDEGYGSVLRHFDPDWVALSGWLKPFGGFAPSRTLNIHPGPLPEFGGKGMYGHHVHEAVIEAYKAHRLTKSAVTMHFVTPRYDEGPAICRIPVEILPTDTAETLQKRVNETELVFQPLVTDLVVRSQIQWDGDLNSPVEFPDNYNLI
ncbi:MAG: phosphoribosylglycinamide formyltransferase [Candidatus Berkelbacteria bacterium]|nr:MAG: phosphoribosylglycinamide formyltransferase [Candidatus Berkelbacteria bacterium]QQG51415.1 MAG: phosphoribosylglycinamide formyltransferase [Candidatus Berkelbacteria bacterium]